MRYGTSALLVLVFSGLQLKRVIGIALVLMAARILFDLIA
jgi:hypothetical protein